MKMRWAIWVRVLKMEYITLNVRCNASLQMRMYCISVFPYSEGCMWFCGTTLHDCIFGYTGALCACGPVISDVLEQASYDSKIDLHAVLHYYSCDDIFRNVYAQRITRTSSYNLWTLIGSAQCTPSRIMQSVDGGWSMAFTIDYNHR